MNNDSCRPYALNAGEGWTYNYGIDFTVLLGEVRHGRGLAIVQYRTRRGEEPPDHTHETEDESFYVLDGSLTFRSGDETFEVESGGFVFLPHGVEHGYTIANDGDVDLIVVTSPAENAAATGSGWGGFIADLEANGELGTAPAVE
jgi:quercetin dioxygenase-like cupin family protein